MSDAVDKVLRKLEALIRSGSHEALETDGLEIKPVPSDGGSWRQIYISANAFLNTRGGILILGVKEQGAGDARRWVHTGYREEHENKLKELKDQYTGRDGGKLDLSDCFPSPQIVEFLEGRVVILYVGEMRADEKYAFFKQKAYKRVLTGDHEIPASEIESQENYKAECWQARELELVPGVGLDDLDVDQLNGYINELNHPVKVETLKPDLESARSFLARKGFVRDGKPTILGFLVCGRHPGDRLGFRCHVHGYVDVPHEVARDKRDMIDNILPLLEQSLGYVLRNIQMGISIEEGGKGVPQYPEEVLRETINNALAHRDYSLNKQVVVSIKPGREIVIQNPGRLQPHLLIEVADGLRRVIPEAKARNPRLADVLRVYRKWEGKGIGMATLVNLCLENRIDLPSYRLKSEEVSLFLRPGPLLDKATRGHLAAFDGYFNRRLGGQPSEKQLLILAYLIKSERANALHHHTILLSPDNNHFDQLSALEAAGVISRHKDSPGSYPMFVVDPALTQQTYMAELQQIFGQEALRDLPELPRRCLDVLCRHSLHSETKAVTAKMAAYALWREENRGNDGIREFDTFYRSIRNQFNTLEKKRRLIARAPNGAKGFIINTSFRSEHPL